MSAKQPRQFSSMTWAMLVLTLSACGGDDSASSEGDQTQAGASGASAGKSGSGSNAKATGGAGGTKSADAKAGSGASGKSSPVATAGSRASADEDAGVSRGEGGGGSSAHAGAGSAGTAAQAGASGSTAGNAAAGSGSSDGKVTFTKVYALFKNTCSGATCHVNAMKAGDMLSMNDQASAYTNLVNADAVSCTGAKRVVAGDPDKSELVHALQHTALSGCARTPKMPDNQPMLSQSDIDLVVSWIKRGAKNE